MALAGTGAYEAWRGAADKSAAAGASGLSNDATPRSRGDGRGPAGVSGQSGGAAHTGHGDRSAGAGGPATDASARGGVSQLTSDEQLMLAHQRGAVDAFAELFARYREPVYGFFRRRLGDAARAEELAQEVFLAVLRGAERWEPRALFRTWLYAIAMKMLWAERRKAARESGSVPVEAAESAGVGAVPNASGETDAALAVRQAVARLDEADREVLLLREYEQLRYDEIAAVLAVPVGTVRSRLFRARIALKELLERP